ncbi:hypothetical protein [Brasilonema bromeliae]
MKLIYSQIPDFAEVVGNFAAWLVYHKKPVETLHATSLQPTRINATKH